MGLTLINHAIEADSRALTFSSVCSGIEAAGAPRKSSD